MMTTTEPRFSDERFTIVSLDDCGTMMVRGTDGATYEVTAFDDGLLCERAKTLSPGSTMRLTLTERADEAGYCLTQMHPEAPTATVGFGAD